jgi:hypothetical protein
MNNLENLAYTQQREIENAKRELAYALWKLKTARKTLRTIRQLQKSQAV